MKRTTKLCAAMSLLPGAIVNEKWLSACESAGKFVDVAPFLFHGPIASDPKGKIKWSFDAVRSAGRTCAPRPSATRRVAIGRRALL